MVAGSEMMNKIEQEKLYEQIEPTLYKAAYHTLKVLKYERVYFDVEELIAEAWIRGGFENCDYVSSRAFYNMIDYIREKRGTRSNRIKLLRSTFNMSYLERKLKMNDREFFLINPIDYFKDMYSFDNLMVLCRKVGLSKLERRVTIEIYYREKNQRETGNVLGYTDSRISQIHSSAIRKMKEAFPSKAIFLEQYG